MIDLANIIIDRSPKDKAAFVNKRRDELKPLGYSVVDSKWLASMMVHANWGPKGQAHEN
jgi:hypothetical protein